MKKTSLYIDDSVDRALAIRAAERGDHEGGVDPHDARRSRFQSDQGEAKSRRSGEGWQAIHRARCRCLSAIDGIWRVTVVLDTSIVVALAIADEPDHESVRDWIAAENDELVTTPLVLAEVDHVIERRAGPVVAERVLADFREGAYRVHWWSDAAEESPMSWGLSDALGSGSSMPPWWLWRAISRRTGLRPWTNATSGGWCWDALLSPPRPPLCAPPPAPRDAPFVGG